MPSPSPARNARFAATTSRLPPPRHKPGCTGASPLLVGIAVFSRPFQGETVLPHRQIEPAGGGQSVVIVRHQRGGRQSQEGGEKSRTMRGHVATLAVARRPEMRRRGVVALLRSGSTSSQATGSPWSNLSRGLSEGEMSLGYQQRPRVLLDAARLSGSREENRNAAHRAESSAGYRGSHERVQLQR